MNTEDLMGILNSYDDMPLRFSLNSQCEPLECYVSNIKKSHHEYVNSNDRKQLKDEPVLFLHMSGQSCRPRSDMTTLKLLSMLHGFEILHSLDAKAEVRIEHSLSYNKTSSADIISDIFVKEEQLWINLATNNSRREYRNVS